MHGESAVYIDRGSNPVCGLRHIFGARRVSPTIRSELEISPSMSASETAEHAAYSSFQVKKHECSNAIVTCATWTEVRHLCYMQPLKNVLPPSDGVLYSTILKRRRLPGTPIPLKCMFLIWYAYNSSFRDARTRTMSNRIASSVVGGSTRSGTNL